MTSPRSPAALAPCPTTMSAWRASPPPNPAHRPGARALGVAPAQQRGGPLVARLADWSPRSCYRAKRIRHYIPHVPILQLNLPLVIPNITKNREESLWRTHFPKFHLQPFQSLPQAAAAPSCHGRNKASRLATAASGWAMEGGTDATGDHGAGAGSGGRPGGPRCRPWRPPARQARRAVVTIEGNGSKKMLNRCNVQSFDGIYIYSRIF